MEIPEDQVPADPALLRELPAPLPDEIAALGPPLAIFRHERRWWLPWTATAKVVICSAGFVRMRSRRLDVCPWNQVRWAEQRGTCVRGSRVYVVECDDGRVFHFDDRLDRIDVLGRIILRQPTPHLLKRALADHAAGRTIDFGMFQVSPAGVARGRDCLPWNRVRVAQRLKHRVWVWQWDQDKPWAQVDADAVAHPEVFVGLVNGIIVGQRDSLG